MEGCLCRGLPWWLEPPCAIDVGPEFLLEFCPGWWVWMACDGCSGAREMPGGFDMINGCELAEVGPLPSSLSAFIISTIVFLNLNYSRFSLFVFRLRKFLLFGFFVLYFAVFLHVTSHYVLLTFSWSPKLSRRSCALSSVIFFASMSEHLWRMITKPWVIHIDHIWSMWRCLKPYNFMVRFLYRAFSMLSMKGTCYRCNNKKYNKKQNSVHTHNHTGDEFVKSKLICI